MVFRNVLFELKWLAGVFVTECIYFIIEQKCKMRLFRLYVTALSRINFFRLID